MADPKLVGQDYVTPDLVAKVTGQAKYAEDFRAEGMLFAKLLLSPIPHGRVRSVDTSAAEAMPGAPPISSTGPPGRRSPAKATNAWLNGLSSVDAQPMRFGVRRRRGVTDSA